MASRTRGTGPGDLWDSEHRRRRRAERARDLLRDLWGDDLPSGPDPVATLLVDAVAADDHLGASDDLVVQSDGLTLGRLADLVRLGAAQGARDLLPPDLLRRLTRQVPPSVGAWEWRVDTGTFAWDGCCARLIRYGESPGGAPLRQVLEQRVHPEDREAVAEGLRGTARTGRPYRADFRVVEAGVDRPGRGVEDWLSAQGRLIDFPADRPPRVIGFVGRRGGTAVPQA